MQRYSGRDFVVKVEGEQVFVAEASLEVDLGTGVASRSGKPAGWLRGAISANGSLKVDGDELDKLLSSAKRAGSWEAMPALDMLFFADVDGRQRKVEAFGCKLKAPGLSINTSEAELVEHEIAYDVTGDDFVRINGIPLAAPRA